MPLGRASEVDAPPLVPVVIPNPVSVTSVLPEATLDPKKPLTMYSEAAVDVTQKLGPGSAVLTSPTAISTGVHVKLAPGGVT